MKKLNDQSIDRIALMMGQLFKPHPWHGISIGKDAPEILTVFIEIVQTDTVKYEIDKVTGYLKVDRPQRYSNIIPSMYGLIPQTYCGRKTADYCMEKTGKKGIKGDSDPLDICVLTEKTISHGDLILEAIPIGGFRMLDGNEADDKIIAVLKDDAIYGKFADIDKVPETVIDRLQHYFLTYKEIPGSATPKCEITHIYNKAEAHEVIRRAQEDYLNRFGQIAKKLTDLLKEQVE